MSDVWKHNGSHLVPTAGQWKERTRSELTPCSQSHSVRMEISTRQKCKSNVRVTVNRRKTFSKKCICDPIWHHFSEQGLIWPSSHAGVPLGYFFFVSKKMPTYFCNSSNCKSSPGWLQAGGIFISAAEDEVVARHVIFTLHHILYTYLEFCSQLWNAVQFTAHLLCLCCSHSYYCTLSTWRPCGSAAVSDCGNCRLAGAEINWDSKDGRCRWAIIARRRSRSLQSC